MCQGKKGLGTVGGGLCSDRVRYVHRGAGDVRNGSGEVLLAQKIHPGRLQQRWAFSGVLGSLGLVRRRGRRVLPAGLQPDQLAGGAVAWAWTWIIEDRSAR